MTHGVETGSTLTPPAVRPLLAASLLVPQMLALGVMTVLAVGWTVGYHPFWPLPDVTLAEAAATRDYAEIVRLIQNGADPNQPSRVRVDVLDGAEHTMTPLAAAVGTGVIEIVQLLLAQGAVVSAGERRDMLICEGVRVDAPDVVELLLKTADGSDPRARCEAILTTH